MSDPVVVNSLGKACPVPVIDLAKAMAEIDVGGQVLLLSDDPGAKVDVPVWCRMKSQELVEVSSDDSAWRFLVRRLS